MPKITRNIDTFVFLKLYGRNGLRSYGHDAIRLVLLSTKKNEGILLVSIICFVLLRCTILSYSIVCTNAVTCLQDSFGTCEWQILASSMLQRNVHQSFISETPALIGDCASFVPLCQAFCNNR